MKKQNAFNRALELRDRVDGESEGTITTYSFTESDGAKMDNTFTYHSPKNDQPSRYEILRAMAKDMAIMIKLLTPPSREQSLALTALEDSNMWCNASIARNE